MHTAWVGLGWDLSVLLCIFSVLHGNLAHKDYETERCFDSIRFEIDEVDVKRSNY